MPRIVHTVEAYPNKGGIGAYLDALLPRLAAAGYEVLLISKGQGPKSTGLSGIEVRYVSDEADLIRDLRKSKPDLVHVHEWPAAEILQAFRDSPEPKIIIHHHAYIFNCPGENLYWRRQGAICQAGFGIRCLWNAYFKRCQRSRRVTEVIRSYRRVSKNLRFAHRGDVFIANSNYVKEKLAEAGIPQYRLSVLNYFTELKYQPQISPVPGRILYIGRVAEAKGVDALLEAVCMLDPGLDWSLVIAGDGYQMPRIKQMVAERGMEEKVHFAGWVTGDQKVRLLHEAAVIAVPSRWPEAFGIVGIEAMACARPVVAFATGGIKDWLISDITGYVVPRGEIGSLTAALEKLIADPNLASQMGLAALKESDRFHSDAHIQKLLEIYRS